LTDAEAAAYLKDLPNDACRVIKCDGSAQSRLETAYDAEWFDFGTKLANNRTSLIIDPPDGKIPPLTDQAQAKLRTMRRSSEVSDDPEGFSVSDRCLVGINAGPPLNPSTYNNLIQIVQAPGYLMLVSEMVHEARVIPLDGRPHVPSTIRRWQG